MSYCRWSSDNWKCDLYCYECVDGTWTTHVAGRKREGEIPGIDWHASTEEIVAAHKAMHEALDREPLVPIGLAYDGRTFKDATLEEFLSTVTMLRDAGYSVPDYVFESIREEIAEEAAADDGASTYASTMSIADTPHEHLSDSLFHLREGEGAVSQAHENGARCGFCKFWLLSGYAAAQIAEGRKHDEVREGVDFLRTCGGISNDGRRSECRRHAPVAGGWPETGIEDWCGDFDMRPVVRFAVTRKTTEQMARDLMRQPSRAADWMGP